MRKSSPGFTLIEMAVVLVIIGLILGMIVLNGGATIGSTKVAKTLAVVNDLSQAIAQFKSQYKALPGDLKVSSTLHEVPGLPSDCEAGGAHAGNENGEIDGTESVCVPEHLYHAGLIRTDGTDSTTGRLVVTTPYGPLRVVSRSASVASALLDRGVQIVIEMDNLPCEVAMELDRKLDNDNIGTGRAIAVDNAGAAVAACAAGSTILHFVVAL